MKQTALLFDLDGTLVDSVPDLAMAANRLLDELGRAPVETAEVARMVGDGVAALVERVLAARGVEAVAADAALRRFTALYEKDAATLTRPYPGVEAVLDRLTAEGVRLAVCTNKIEAATRRVLEGVGLARFFSVLLCGDSLAQRKPDPAPLVAALDRLGATPDVAAMVGDHRNDVLAAHGAGVPAIFARYGYGLATLGALRPDAVIDSFGELPHALEVLGSQSSVISRS